MARIDVPRNSGTYQPLSFGVPNRTIFFGDSITIGDSALSPHSRGTRDPYAWASMFNPKIMYARNAGISTQGSADLLARIQSDVIAYSPDVVIINVGTNDAGNSVALSTYAANVKAIIAAIKASGARCVLSTVIPSANTTRQQYIDTYNAWLAYYCAREHVPLLDYHRLLVDPSTGGLLAAYDLDGTHPNVAAAKQMGLLVADELDGIYQPWEPPLAGHQAAGSKNLIPGGLFLVDTNADGLSDGFTKTAGGTASRVTGDPTIKGTWQRLTDTSTSQAFISSSPNLTTGWSVGDVVAVCGRVTIVNGTSTAVTGVQLSFNGGTPNSVRPLSAWTTDVENGVFYAEDTIPAGTTSIGLNFNRTASVAGNGYAQIAQFTVLNLTTLGVIAA